jgi:hypothetical protein
MSGKEKKFFFRWGRVGVPFSNQLKIPAIPIISLAAGFSRHKKVGIRLAYSSYRFRQIIPISIHGSIYRKIPTRGGGISADVIWGKNMKRGREKKKEGK